MDDILVGKAKVVTKTPAVKAAAPQKLQTPAVEAPKPVAPTPPQPASDEKPVASRGRPTVHVGGSQKCTVVLLNDQIHWLKLLEHSIYLASQTTISRAELIRAMIDAVIESSIDLSQVTSEEEAKALILKHLKK